MNIWDLMDERFGKDNVLALATLEDGLPAVRYVNAYYERGAFYISFTNLTAGKKLHKVGSVFKTTKGAGHGFGLERIDSIVQRLHGYLSRASEDGAFTTEILLPQELADGSVSLSYL